MEFVAKSIRCDEKSADIMETGNEELEMEFIDCLFFKMQISDVRDKIQQFSCVNNRYALRLHKVGLMAECGLLESAYSELKVLIDELEEAITNMPREKIKILYNVDLFYLVHMNF